MGFLLLIAIFPYCFVLTPERALKVNKHDIHRSLAAAVIPGERIYVERKSNSGCVKCAHIAFLSPFNDSLLEHVVVALAVAMEDCLVGFC